LSGPWERYAPAEEGPWARYSPPQQAPDAETGAPANVRAAVGAAQTPADRLATIRRFYPDAEPHGADNFIFQNPRTGRPTIYNPPGFQPLGDMASLAPEVGEFLGGMVGGALAVPPAIAGAPATGGASFLAVPAAVGLGAAGGRELATLGANAFAGTVDRRSPTQRVTDAATTAGVNALAGPAVDAALRGTRWALGPVRRLYGGRGAATAEDFAGAGVRTSAGDVTGNPGTQSLQAVIAASPTGARRMATFTEGQVDDLGRAVAQTAEGIGVPTTPQNAGATLREGAGRAVERFTERQGRLYDEAFEAIGADTRVNFPAVQALRQQIAAEIEQAPASAGRRLAPVLQRIDDLLADSGPGGLAFGAMRRERTALGQRIGQPSVSASAPDPEAATYFRRMYGALTEDMTAHAASRGDDAARALALADRYTKFNRNVNLPYLERLQRQGTDQQVFDLVFPRSGRPDAQTLARITRQMTPEERRTLAATVLDRMGNPTPGAQAAEDFSAATFLTNWNRLTQNGQGAREVLFGGADTELGRNLDRLARVASAMRDTARYTNWSNTGRVLAGAGVVGAVGTPAMEGDMGGVAQAVGLTLVAPAVGARLLTNPAFVGWLAGTAPAIANGQVTPAVTRSLARVSAANPAIRDAIEEYQAAIASQPPQRAPATQSR
jgi:hypothetical protein